jgi:hypothetical protein
MKSICFLSYFGWYVSNNISHSDMNLRIYDLTDVLFLIQEHDEDRPYNLLLKYSTSCYLFLSWSQWNATGKKLQELRI